MSDKIEIWAVKKGDEWLYPENHYDFKMHFDKFLGCKFFTSKEYAEDSASEYRWEAVAIHDLIKKQVLDDVREFVEDEIWDAGICDLINDHLDKMEKVNE